MNQTLDHPALVKSLRTAYSAEKAAAFAYIGHAGSVGAGPEREHIHEIEQDEWNHRREVKVIMDRFGLPVSSWYEFKYHVIGRVIGASCYVIGHFMPYFFAGKLESGNVCEYFVMIRHFHALGITEFDDVLYEMGIKEKEHEVYFMEMIRDARWLPLFERIFSWGATTSLNDVDLARNPTVENAEDYCRNYRAKKTER
ncbi:MAG: hypothetical protein HOH58_14055 [Opitutaceae bacterium]|jgi:hypothetical protein|nr:hypothetical protein [Opitutaceae bacterium]